jgi:hypothetical protein
VEGGEIAKDRVVLTADVLFKGNQELGKKLAKS